MSTRDDLMATLACESVPVEGIPGWDGKLTAHTLSALDGLPYSEAIESLDQSADRVRIFAELVVRTIRNGDGSLVFTPEDATELPTRHGSRFWCLANAAMRANGMGGDEELAKNSPEPEGESGAI